MNKKFEQLIEYVINDEEDKARALFHDIVVEKSRQIYEEMMDAEEEIEEAKEEEEESVEEAKEEEESVEEAREEEEESLEEMMGGDSADDLIDDVDVEEEGISMEADDEEGMDDMGADEAGGDDIEGKLMNIEDKLDELMAEFEALMGDDGMGDDDMGGEEELDIDIGGDEDGMDMDGEMDMDMGDEEPMPMGEAISLKAAPKPTTSEEGGINKKSIVAANSGARGMEGKPVHTGTSMGGKHDAAGAYSNNVKDLISDVQNAPAKAKVTQKPAPKPHLAQATGVNTKSPL